MSAPAGDVTIAEVKLVEDQRESAVKQSQASSDTAELEENKRMLTTARINEVTSKRKMERACVYQEAAKRAAATQGKALCIAKTKSLLAEYDATEFLREFEAEGSKTALPVKITYDPETEWASCIGGLGCKPLVAKILTAKAKNFGYPYKITFQLPEGSTGHVVEV